jgi:PAS domain S-box-containing protein
MEEARQPVPLPGPEASEPKQTGPALWEGEERFRRIFSVSPIGMAVTDLSDRVGRFLDVNRAFCAMLGYVEPELTNLTFADVTHPDDLAESRRLTEALLNGSVPSFRLEKRYLARSGATIWANTTATIIRNKAAGKAQGLVIVEDVSERRRDTVALQQSEERFRRIVETASEGIWMLDAGCRTTFVNGRLAEILGYPVAELLGRPTEDFIFPEDLPAHARRVALRARGESDTYELRLRRRDGAELWALVSASPVLDAQGRYNGSFAMLSDITERKRAELALRRGEQRLRNAQALGRIGSWLCDLATGAIEWSDETFALYERSRALGPPTPDEEAGFYAPEEAARLRALAVEAVAEGKDVECDLTARLPSRRTAFFHTTIHPVHDAAGKVTQLEGTVQDVTARRQSEQALADQRALLDTIYEQAPVVILLLDSELRVRKANRAATQVADRRDSDMPGLLCGDALCCVHAAESGGGCGQTEHCPACVIRNTVTAQFSRDRPSDNVEVELVRGGTWQTRSYLLSTAPVSVGGERLVLASLMDITRHKRAERALRQSEERYRSIVEASPAGIVTVDLLGKVLSVNEAFVRLTGFPAGAFVGRHFLQMPTLARQDSGLLRDIFARAVSGSLKSPVEFKWLHADGSVRDGEATVSTPGSAGPAGLGLQVIVADITERKRAEEESSRRAADRARTAEVMLRVARAQTEEEVCALAAERLHEICPECYVVVSLYDPRLKGIRFRAHAGFGRLLDMALKVLGQDVRAQTFSADDLPPEERARYVSGRLHEIEGGTYALAMGMIPKAAAAAMEGLLGVKRVFGVGLAIDGVPYGAAMLLSRTDGPVKDGHAIESFVSQVAASVHRLHAEQALRESEQQVRGIAEQSPNMVFINREGRVVYANQKSVDILGYSREEFYSPDFDFLKLIAPESVDRVKSTYVRHGRGEEVEPYEMALVAKDGRRVESIIATKLVDLDGARAVLGIVTDITERKRVESALSESEEKFRYVFDHSPIGKSLTLLSGEVRPNRALADMLGYTQAELERLKWQEITDPDDIVPTQRVIDSLLTGECDSVRIVKRYIHKNGSVVWADLAASLRRDALGRPQYLMTSIMDVTERERAEEELERARKTLEEAQKIGHLGSFENVTATRTTVWSKEEYRIYGLDPADPSPTYDVLLSKFIHPDDRSLVHDIYKKALQHRSVYELEHRIVRPNGSVRWVYNRARPCFDAQGEITRYIGTTLDVTERKLAEETVKAERDRARLYLDIVGSIVIALDRTGRITLVNRMACEVLGYQEEELLGRSWPDTCIPERLRDQVKEVFGQLMAGTGTPFEHHENPVLTKTGQERQIEWYNVVLRGEDGLPSGTLSAGMDVTERRQTEAALHKAGRELELHRDHLEHLVAERTRELEAAQGKLVLQEKLATLGRVAGSVAHELRNPLGAIRNASFFLQQTAADKLEGKPLRHLQTIDAAAQRADQAVTTILDFTWQQQGEQKRHALKTIVDQAVADAAVPATVRVAIELPAQLPPVEVDERQMVTVFRNLLINAVQAMPWGGTITVAAATRDKEVVVTVSDTGSGIRPEHVQRVFEPLFTTKSIGVGLGLAICRAFVEANKGTISVASEVGKGTTFTITLPAAEDSKAS